MTYLCDIDTFNCLSNIGDKIVPMVLNSGIKIPVLNTVTNTVLPIVNNTSIDTISSDTILPPLNNVSIGKMEFLANNFVHIFNMNNIAIDILCNKANTSSSSVMNNFNVYKSIILKDD